MAALTKRELAAKISDRTAAKLAAKYAGTVARWYADVDGFWFELRPGFNFWGCSQVHAETCDTVESADSDLGQIEAGETY